MKVKTSKITSHNNGGTRFGTKPLYSKVLREYLELRKFCNRRRLNTVQLGGKLFEIVTKYGDKVKEGSINK